MKIAVALFLFLFNVKSFAQGFDSPGDNLRKKYSEELFLSAVGSGDTRNTAQSNASANLALIFESSVKVSDELTQNFKESASGENYKIESASETKKNIALGTSQTLYNVNYSESASDNTGKVYIVAYIDRLETAEIYKDKINSNAETIKFFSHNALGSQDIITTYAYLNKSFELCKLNRLLMDQLKIILPEYSDYLMIDYDENDILQQFTSARQKISFSITVNNDNDNKVSSIIADAINSTGFLINDDPVFYLSCSVGTEKADIKNKQEFLRWNYDLVIRDQSNNTIISFSDSGREGHLTIAEAKNRVYLTIKKRLKNRLVDSLNHYFSSFIKK